MSGHIQGGQQPVTGANIYLYAVGSTGDGSASAQLLKTAVQSDQYGNFTITNDYTCPTAQTLVYIVAQGGNPGMPSGTNNPALAMMAGLGACGQLTPSTSIFIDEVTTVGSLAALYAYSSGYAAIGSNSGDLLQLQNAFSLVNEYTNITSGLAPGPALPSGYYASTVAVNSLANVISACINSAGGTAGDGTACGTLFQLAKPASSPAPTDVIGAVIDILNNPTQNVTSIYNLSPSIGAPFQPALSSAPSNWTLPIIQIPANPLLSLPTGIYVGTQTLTISETTLGATVYYTTDGSTPTTASKVYSGPITIASSETVKAIANSYGLVSSGISSATYTITAPPPAATPTFTPNGGTFSTSQTVTISSTTTGAAIYYTTDGSTPTVNSTQYVAPITVYETETVKAIAIGNGTSASAVGSASFALSNVFGTITTVAGNGIGAYSGDGGPATAAEINFSYGGATDAAGNFYFADFRNNRVRKISTTGVITTIAGTGVGGYNGDGIPATTAYLNAPSAVAVDASGNIYIDDDFNYRIRKISQSGMISTIAGNGSSNNSGDGGPAVSGSITPSCGIAVDSNGNLYIAECNSTTGSRIRMVSASGIISTFAGTGTYGFGGDGGAATSALLSTPQGISVDSSNNVYFADTANNRIRKIDNTGTITTVAGNGTGGYSGDNGAATSAELNQPNFAAVDAAGNIYIADTYNNRVRKVSTSGIITTAAGTGVANFSGDGGPAVVAALDEPSSVSLDPFGNLFIIDQLNYRIREVTFGATGPQVSTPTFSVAAGTYNSTQYVVLSSSTSSATIYYTLDGSTPTASSSAYTTPITVSSSETIKAIGIANGYASSPVASAAYVITNLPVAAVPTFSPAPGSYTAGQTVTLSDTLSSATIYYTTDGSLPTTASPVYTSAIPVPSSLTIRALAVASGYAPSSIGVGGYYINQGVGIITTIAGNGTSGFTGDGGLAISAEVSAVRGMATDSFGNLYFADPGNYRVRKISTAGVISTVAGSGTYGFAGDGGLATSAALSNPTGVCIDNAGNVYIADTGNYRVRKVTPAGIISTVVGNGAYGSTGDGGLATAASVYPSAVAVDQSGNLYVSDSSGSRIRMVNAAGIISTIAGSGTSGFSGDGGAATSATLSNPEGVALDSTGNIYIADYGNNRIRKINSLGIISTFAGSGGFGYTGDGGAATSATLEDPSFVATDSAGNVYLSDQSYHVRTVNSAGIISTVAGNGSFGTFSGDGGPATAAGLYFPNGVAVDPVGNVYIADSDNYRIRKVSYSNAFQTAAPSFSVPAGTYTAVQYVTISSPTPGAVVYYTVDGTTPTVSSTLYTIPVAVSSTETVKAIAQAPGYSASSTVSMAYNVTVLPVAATPAFSPAAGTYTSGQTVTLTSGTAGSTIYYTTDGSTPSTSSLVYSGPIAVNSSETINAIATASGYNPSLVGTAGFYINPGAGIITTVAGDGASGFAGDGSAATSASLGYPSGVVVDSLGNLYIADSYNARIRKVNPSGIISTFAGTGTSGYSGDGGQAVNAKLNSPRGLALDLAGNLYVVDSGNSTVRKISPAGIITTVAGNGTAGFLGDGGAANAAELNQPYGVAVDASGNVYIADYYNYRIRKVTPAGIITTIAGTGTYGFTGDGGPATSATMTYPISITVDTAGNVYFGDYYNYRVRKISTGGTISTYAGNSYGFGGDGSSATASTAKISYPTSVAIDAAGNLYIGDGSNYRIRVVSPAGILSTVSGTGTYGFTGDAGPAASAEISSVYGFAFDSKGNVYFSDQSNYRIRKITH